MTNYVEIPTYLNQADYENYSTDFNQSIRQLLGSDFWIMPSITTAQTVILEPEMPVGSFWFNTDLKKMQLKTDTGIIETVTSV